MTRQTAPSPNRRETLSLKTLPEDRLIELHLRRELARHKARKLEDAGGG